MTTQVSGVDDTAQRAPIVRRHEVYRPPRPRLLAITPSCVWPVTDGITLRIHSLLEELASAWDITLIAAMPAGPGAAVVAPPSSIALAGYDPVALSGRWRTIPSQFDVRPLVSATRRAITRFRPTATLLWPGAEFLAWTVTGMPRSVADRIDCLALTTWRSARREFAEGSRLARRLWSSATAAHNVAAIASYERRIVRRLAATVVVGHDDASALRRMASPGMGDRLQVISNGVAVPSAEAKAKRGARSRQPTVVFTGTLNYEPNVAAARELAERIWPLVSSQVPSARLVIAGRKPTPEVMALAASPTISVLADVACMDDVFATAWVGAAPMVTGSGVKNKALEAWAQGLPVVMSRLAINGLPLPPGHEALIADDHQTAADIIVRLLRSADERSRLGVAARRFVPGAFSWHSAAARLSELLQ